MLHVTHNLYGEYLMKEALAEVGDFKIGGRIINKVRFADDTAIIAKDQKELQRMVNRLVDAGRKYGMGINIDKSLVMRASRNNESLWFKVGNSELKAVEIILNTLNVFYNKRLVIHKRNQDNCYGQRSV